jgi:hypothetical protein
VGFAGIKALFGARLPSNPSRFYPPTLSRSDGGGRVARGRCSPATARASAARPKAAGVPLFSVLSLFLPPFPSPKKREDQRVYLLWRPGGEGGGAVAGPLAGARVPRRVSAPPSSGSVVVPRPARRWWPDAPARLCLHGARPRRHRRRW